MRPLSPVLPIPLQLRPAWAPFVVRPIFRVDRFIRLDRLLRLDRFLPLDRFLELDGLVGLNRFHRFGRGFQRQILRFLYRLRRNLAFGRDAVREILPNDAGVILISVAALHFGELGIARGFGHGQFQLKRIGQMLGNLQILQHVLNREVGLEIVLHHFRKLHRNGCRLARIAA